VKLTITHTMEKKDSELIKKVSGGWPYLLASLKSLLETGNALEGSDRWPEGISSQINGLLRATHDHLCAVGYQGSGAGACSRTVRCRRSARRDQRQRPAQ